MTHESLLEICMQRRMEALVATVEHAAYCSAQLLRQQFQHMSQLRNVRRNLHRVTEETCCS